jgi:DNA polymerase-3 subunit beta
MRLTCRRAVLLKGLQTVARAVPTRTLKEILKNVHCAARDGAVRLTASDTEIGLLCVLDDVTINEPGECLLPTVRLITTLDAMTCDEIVLDSESSRLELRGGQSEFRLLVEDPADFPPVAEFESESYYKLKGSDLRRAIKHTAFCCDPESSRYALAGVQVEFHAEGAIFAATDSRRLAVDRCPFDVVGQPQAQPASVVPAKALKLLQVIAEDAAEVRILMTANSIAVQCGAMTLTSQFVQGRFPDWRRVIPTHFVAQLSLLIGPFHAAVRQALIVRSEESRGVDFKLGAGTLQLSSSVADLGASKIDLPVGYEGKSVTCGFDPQFFADALKLLEGVVEFHVAGPDDASMLEQGEFRYVIMPLHRGR